MLVSGNANDILVFKAELSSAVVAQEIKTGESISVLRKDRPEELMVLVSALILDVTKHVNVKRSLTTDQVSDLAFSLVKNWWYFKISEFVYVFENAKSGKYGSNFETLSADKIEGWFFSYDTDERLAILERTRKQSEQEHLTPEEHAKFQEKFKKQAETFKVKQAEQKEQAKIATDKARQDVKNAFPGIVSSEQNSRRVRELYAKFFERYPNATDEDFFKYESHLRNYGEELEF